MAFYKASGKKKKVRKALPRINYDGTMLSRLSTGTKLYKEIKEHVPLLLQSPYYP